MRHREDAALDNDRAVELRWWQMNSAQKTMHVTGVWRDSQMSEYERDAARARRSHHRLAVLRGTLIRQLNVAERLGAAVLDKIRPEAERVPLERQQKGRGHVSGTRGDSRRLARPRL